MRVWLKEIRKSLGLSSYKAAEMAGLSQSYYSAIENGVRGRKLTVPTAKKIAAALGFDWQRFYEDEDVSACEK